MAIPSHEAKELCQAWEDTFTRYTRVDESTFVTPGREPLPHMPSPRIAGPPMIMSAMLMLSESLDVTELHALKAEFLRLGDPTLDLRYDIEPLRDTRNFTTRRVRVTQREELCAVLTLSFTRQWDGLSHQIVECPSDFGDPESFPEMWQVNNFPSRPKMGPIENRLDVTDKAPKVRAYMRIVPEFSDNPVWRAAQRAALTDGPAAITALRYHGLPLGSQASLDHQAWFHRPLSFDGWHVYDLFSDIAVGNRALVHGRIWDEQGNLHATVMQEVTYRRPDA